MVIELFIESIRLDTVTNQPVVILRDEGAKLFLPIWIGSYEATAIAMEMEGVKSSRPMTHDLMASMIIELKNMVDSVTIQDLVDGTYYATIRLSDGKMNHDLDARPSDAIALALRTKSSIFASDKLGKEMIPLAADEGDHENRESREMEEFRRFLDKVKPEDFQ